MRMVTLVLGAITLALLEAEHALPFRSWSCDFPGTVVSGAGPNRLPLVLDDIRVLSWRVDLAKYVLEADSRTLRGEDFCGRACHLRLCSCTGVARSRHSG
jgi:hypothetical protein